MISFQEFANVMYRVMGDEQRVGLFTQELFYGMVTGEQNNPVDNISVDTFQKYFNGTNGISYIARKIKGSLEPTHFSEMLYEKCSDSMSLRLVKEFDILGIPISKNEFADDIADIFSEIIMDAVSSKKNTAKSQGLMSYFSMLLNKYSRMKTMLYLNEAVPVSNFYVPNDVFLRKGERVPADKLFLSGKKRYAVIKGSGGLGKSMLMRHLTLELVNHYDKYKKIPILIHLKDYDSRNMDLITIIKQDTKKLPDIQKCLEDGQCVILLDGMDEIRSSESKRFEMECVRFVDEYPKNTYIMSSRPISKFLAFQKFEPFDLAPFTKEQALKLVEKLVYRPDEPFIKASFLEEINTTLYETHRDFVENPLLLTIMLMTYERYAQIPYKRHIFYCYAFHTLAEINDATKIGFKRVFRTGLQPENFSEILEEFCTRTYLDEKFAFTESEFRYYFDHLKSARAFRRKIRDFSWSDLLYDFTMNLCIMTHDDRKYCLIHRSFQEYFCALHLSKSSPEKMPNIQNFFETRLRRVNADYTFEMMYDLEVAKVEKCIFIPYLTERFQKYYAGTDEKGAYWNFLSDLYPRIYYHCGEVETEYENEPASYTYGVLLHHNGIDHRVLHDVLEVDEKYVIRKYVQVETRSKMMLIPSEQVYDMNQRSIVRAKDAGWICEIHVEAIRQEKSQLHDAMEEPTFPYYREFIAVQRLLKEMEANAEELTDDLYCQLC